MASHHDHPPFHPSPPARTSTLDSQTSTTSPPLSPTPSRSPTEDTFFGAITARMRRARTRSRSPAHPHSKPHMAMPPQRLPSSGNTHSLSQHDAGAAARTTAPSAAAAAKPSRPSLQGDGRRMSGGDPWRGRHSNSWLFNDFSVTGTAKSLLERRKS